MDAKTAAFDKSMEQETARRDCRDSGEDGGGHERAPCKRRQNQRPCLRSWEDNYNRHHEEYAEALFQKMIKGEIMGSLIAYSGISHQGEGNGTLAYKKMSSSLRWRP